MSQHGRQTMLDLRSGQEMKCFNTFTGKGSFEEESVQLGWATYCCSPFVLIHRFVDSIFAFACLTRKFTSLSSTSDVQVDHYALHPLGVLSLVDKFSPSFWFGNQYNYDPIIKWLFESFLRFSKVLFVLSIGL